ncbi:MAG TPA: hypothetical protein VFI82_01105 [Terriglobales bacterium]|jgi:hypothetical protein|nr:hypothetical protein [Terriglobales bacterium]
MTDRVVGKILACLLAVLLPSAAMSAETQAAMLYTSNPVKVNGIGAERSSAVFAGDRIETPANTTVTLTAAGSTVMVGPVSSLVYEGEALRLGSGSTVVTTEKGMKTQVQRLVISPAAAQQRSSYGVIRSDGQVMIAAFHGSVKILDGASEKIVADGDTASIPDPETSEQGGAQPAATTGRIGNHKMSTAALLLLLIGAAAAAGIIVYETTKTPVSGH